jgi:hypothetical protein
MGSKFIVTVTENSDRISQEMAAKGLEDAKAFAEALVCDRYFLTSSCRQHGVWF